MQILRDSEVIGNIVLYHLTQAQHLAHNFDNLYKKKDNVSLNLMNIADLYHLNFDYERLVG